jgi:hypothetical protein
LPSRREELGEETLPRRMNFATKAPRHEERTIFTLSPTYCSILQGQKAQRRNANSFLCAFVHFPWFHSFFFPPGRIRDELKKTSFFVTEPAPRFWRGVFVADFSLRRSYCIC